MGLAMAMGPMDAAEAVVPGGFAEGDGWQRTAALRPVAGSDEAYLADGPAGSVGPAGSPAAQTTALLARCLERLGTRGPVTPADVRALTVGDREALLLQLRRLTFGDRLECVLTCPVSECGEKMDLELRVGDLLLPPYAWTGPSFEATLADDERGVGYRARFRLPTGADQETVAALARTDADAAVRLVLERCVERVEDDDGRAVAVDALPPAVVAALSAAMAERDPQAETILELTCPACEAAFTAPFDAAAYLRRELRDRGRELYREVHQLALAYHWSEAEILAMTGRKRRLYLGLLAETAGAGLAGGGAL
jgi:hypothetical protein